MLILFNLLFFLLPTQFGLHLNFLSSTVFGFKIDYLIPVIYITDVLIFLIVIFNLKKIKVKLFPTLLFIGFVIINILFSSYKIASTYKWIKLIEMIFFGVVIFKIKSFNIYKNFVKPLSFSILIICILGIAQWLIGKSIGGPFYLLGERSFRLGDPGISSFSLAGIEMLRPYSVFSHPNSFAGFLLVFSIFLLKFKKTFNKKYFYFLSTLILSNLFLTFSFNIFLTIIILIFIYFAPILKFSVFLIDFTTRSFTHRIELLESSVEIIKKNFLIGVGLNNFIPSLTNVTNKFLNSWELQPVHNIFLLIFSEAGIVGFLTFIFIIYKSIFSLNKHKYILFSLYAILISGLFDHYWLTLQQNMLLFTFVLALSFRYKRK